MTDTPDTGKQDIASLDTLCALHRQLAESFLEKLRKGEATAADLAAAVQYLRLNGCYRGGDLSPGQMGDAMRDLAELPEFDDSGAEASLTGEDGASGRVVPLR